MLKADRLVVATEIGYYLNTVTDKGVFVAVNTAGSGVALDNTNNLAQIAANSSGVRPLGMLLNEFVSVDQTRFPINWHKDQSIVGDKAVIMNEGWAVTNYVVGTPAGGDHAILSSSGYATNLAPGGAWNEAANPKLGQFRTKVDSQGFARIYVRL